MSLEQLNFDGETKIEHAISIIRNYKPFGDPYVVAFSGGKDSIVTLDLVRIAARDYNIPYEVHYNRTGIDPPEVVKFIRENYPEVVEIPPVMSMWRGIEKNGLPIRTRRWCCQVLKEHSGSGRRLIAGIRRAESRNRANRPEFYIYDARKAKQKYIKNKEFVLPIANFTDVDVWRYIHERGLKYPTLYDQGFKRIGCIMCPFCGGEQLEREMTRYPKIALAYLRAAERYYDKHEALHKLQPSGEAYFRWWLTRK